jgi:hypothetical protein
MRTQYHSSRVHGVLAAAAAADAERMQDAGAELLYGAKQLLHQQRRLSDIQSMPEVRKCQSNVPAAAAASRCIARRLTMVSFQGRSELRLAPNRMTEKCGI